MIRYPRLLRGLFYVGSAALVLLIVNWYFERHRITNYLLEASLPIDYGSLELVGETYKSYQFGASSRQEFEFKLPPDVSGIEWCGKFGFPMPTSILIEKTKGKALGCRKTHSSEHDVTVSYTVTIDRLYMKILI